MSGALMGVLIPCFVATLMLTTVRAAVAQDSWTKARDLYTSAAYDEALALLNRLRSADHSADEARSIEQYRAFCLLALGRADEAERAIEAVVAAQPSYHPSQADMSPRLRSAFSDVRRRMLPAIIQDKYVQAKAAFDRKEFAAAAAGFKLVLDVLADPDLGAAAHQIPLSDLRTLAAGFRELSEKAAAPPPGRTQPEPAPPPKPAPQPIYDAVDGSVTLPVAVRQSFPSYSGPGVPSSQGIVEVVIDATGAVESATMKASVDPAYDSVAIAAAKTWLYKPAMLNGVPVKYRKLIAIMLKPAR